MEHEHRHERQQLPPGFANSPFTSPSRQLPPGVVRNSLHVIESFFGADLHEEHLTAVERLPPEQLGVLIDNLEEHTIRTFDILAGRNVSVRSIRHVEVPAEYQGLWQGNIHVHESSMLRAGASTDIANVDILKHLVLYCDKVWVRDPLAMFVVDRADDQLRTKIRNGIRQLLPVANLARSGCLILGYTPRIEKDRRGEPRIYGAAGMEDPYYAWLFDKATADTPELRAALLQARAMSNVEGSETTLREVGRSIFEAVSKIYPYKISGDSLRDITAYVTSFHEHALTPITSSPAIRHHLQQGARILLGEVPAAESLGATPLISPVSHQIPQLSDVSFDDIAQLRQDEEVFAVVRNALSELTQQCARIEAPETLAEYQRFIHGCAGDIVGPAFDQLQRWQKVATLARAGKLSVAKIATFGLDGLVEVAAEAAGMAGEPLIGRPEARRIKNIGVACGILASIRQY